MEAKEKDLIRFIIPEEAPEIRGDLPFRGSDPEGNVYSADGRSLLRNGRRFIPVMGEIHFSRLEPHFWREEILKMKAGGVDIAATYLFWLHHEEQKGVWDFSGCRDVRRFVEICGECGMKVFLRIGPWAHGECRNGGFPDWLQEDQSFEKRVNSPEYLALVRSWFEKIFEEVRGLFFADGGPIIGVQLENEYGHCGGPKEKERQEAHMKELYRMVREIGFTVPYHTATAWGGACTIDETLQVLSGYVDAPWDSGVGKLPPKDNFRFLPYFDDADTGSDFREGEDSSSSIRRDYPYLTAELGGGLQVTSHRRPIASSKDHEAAILCAIGSGANLIGYYMYHGGINPDGQCSTLNEAQDIGGHTTTPVKSYDFDACLNEAGKPQKSFGGLKKYAHFLHAYGEDLADTEVLLPEQAPESAADLQRIRAALRLNRASGNAYLFVNNHQRLYELSAHPDTTAELVFPDGSVRRYEQLSFAPGTCSIIRFRPGDETQDIFAANPLCRMGGREFFWLDGAESTASVMSSKGEARVEASHERGNTWDPSAAPGRTVLSESAANRAFLYEDGLYITSYDDSILIEDCGVKKLISTHEEELLTIYKKDGSVEKRRISAGKRTDGEISFRCTEEVRDQKGRLLYRSYMVRLSYAGLENGHRVFLKTAFRGDRAEVYLDGKLADDWFTTGKDWNILLDRFGRPKKLEIRIYDSENTIPCSFSQDVYYDLPVEKGCEITGMEIGCEYLTEI